VLAGVVALVITGAFVSQKHAGLAYPDWPLFGGSLLPNYSADGGVASLQLAHVHAAGLLVGLGDDPVDQLVGHSAGGVRSASPASGVEASAYSRRGIRPACRASQPASTAARIARAMRTGSSAREIALHVAAAAPRWISRDEVPAQVIEVEKEVALEQARNEGRPEAAWDKIVEGRLNNFFKETVLLEQAYVREPKTTIENLIKEQIAKLQENITVRRFVRYNVKE